VTMGRGGTKTRIAVEIQRALDAGVVVRITSLVDKWNAIGCAFRRADLGRAELSILWVLLDWENSDVGAAWPSYATLAKRAGVKPRHAKGSVASLVQRGLVEITVPGDRVYTNHYRVCVPKLLAEGSAPQNTMPAQRSAPQNTTAHALGGAVQTTTVVHCSARGGALQCTEVVSCSAPNPIHDPAEHLAKQDHESMDDDQSSSGRRAGSASPADEEQALVTRAQRHAAFWDAWPLDKAEASKVNELLDQLLDCGETSLTVVVAGLARFAHYMTKTRKGRSALAWLEHRGWLDDWTPYDERPARRRGSAPLAVRANSTAAAPASSLEAAHTDHMDGCAQCSSANHLDDMCAIGRELDEAATAIEIALQAAAASTRTHTHLRATP
jgi:hypothetical protein